MVSALIGQAAPPPVPIGDPPSAWLPVVLLIVIGILFAAGNVIASVIIGPSRTGPGKSATYESGMMPVGDTRRQYLALQVGSPYVFSESEQAACRTNLRSPALFRKAWEHYRARLD